MKLAEKIETTLQRRIQHLRDEIEWFVGAYAEEKAKGTGLPVGIVMQTITGGSPCRCNVALKVIATKEQDESDAAKPAA
jgi:hypothetical protein